jgi:hypothetical protein
MTTQWFGEDMLPVVARSGEAMKQKERLAGSGIAVKQLQSIHINAV